MRAFVTGAGGFIGGALVRRVAVIGGQRPPRLTIPAWLLRAIAPLGGLIGPALGVAPNLGEVIRAADGVTYWASDARARLELGYAPRDLEAGLRSLVSLDTGAGVLS